MQRTQHKGNRGCRSRLLTFTFDLNQLIQPQPVPLILQSNFADDDSVNKLMFNRAIHFDYLTFMANII